MLLLLHRVILIKQGICTFFPLHVNKCATVLDNLIMCLGIAQMRRCMYMHNQVVQRIHLLQVSLSLSPLRHHQAMPHLISLPLHHTCMYMNFHVLLYKNLILLYLMLGLAAEPETRGQGRYSEIISTLLRLPAVVSRLPFVSVFSLRCVLDCAQRYKEITLFSLFRQFTSPTDPLNLRLVLPII